MAAESSGEEIREGFLCPICMKDLRTPSQLSTHFEEFHAEDKDILRQLRSVFGRAKNKILNRDEPTRPSSQIPSSEGSKTAFVSRGTPGSGGIDLLLWDPQEIGGTRNHLKEFRRIRQDKIEKFIVETNNILIRLDKLLKSGIYNSESTLAIAMKARKDVEKRVVPWESDNDVKYCRNCSKKFKVLVFRKHHCRLCGRVYCGECCDYISAVEANDILHSEKITKFGTESNSNESEDKNGIRTCFSCLELLQRHCQIRNDIQAKPDVVGLYEASPEDSRFKKVKYILLDPTCSGSGMVSRMDQLLDDDNSSDRLQKRLEALSKFQYAMLCHALSFPKVKKVAYSTCSVHQQENETVVERALLRFKETFSMVNLLPSWENRGLPVFEQGPYCLRASPEKDRTNGFFVAVFKRIKGKKPREEHGTENEKPLITSEETIHHKSKKRKLADNEVNLETLDPSNRAEIEQPQEERKLQNGAKRRKKKSKDDKTLKNEGHANIIIDSKKRQKKNSKRRKRTLKTPVTA